MHDHPAELFHHTPSTLLLLQSFLFALPVRASAIYLPGLSVELNRWHAKRREMWAGYGSQPALEPGAAVKPEVAVTSPTGIKRSGEFKICSVGHLIPSRHDEGGLLTTYEVEILAATASFRTAFDNHCSP